MNGLGAHWDVLKQDLRYTARTLGRARGFAMTAILVTALGVGANTAAFSLADFVLFRSLPFTDPERLVRLCEGPRSGGGWGCMNQLSPANYRDFKARSGAFEGMGAFAGDSVNLVGGGEPRRLPVTPVTPEVFPVLGVAPALGRVFAPGDADADAVVLSDGLWRSQFGADPNILGRTINLSGAPYTVIGVMPPSFYFPNRDQQLWTPLIFRDQNYANRGNSYIEGVARLKPGVTFEQARSELEAIALQLGREYPATNAETGISFYRMRDAMSPRFRVMLTGLGGATLCLLLLTCANLANLLLARAAARERELAVRAALGAGTKRLVRQLITESVILTLLGESPVSRSRRRVSRCSPASYRPHCRLRTCRDWTCACSRWRVSSRRSRALASASFLRCARCVAPASPRCGKEAGPRAAGASASAPFWSRSKS
jgi:predicted permease